MLKTFSGRSASQDEGELLPFIAMMNRLGVRSYLEVGAREGDTFHEVMIGLTRGSRGVALDLPGGLWGKVTTREQLERAVADLRGRDIDASCMFGPSQAAGTFSLARGRGPYDAILIDGDHTYEGVSADWKSYGRLAPIIAFHDIVGDGQIERVTGRSVEVPKLWAEIKAAGRVTREFVAPVSTMGIGVVFNDTSLAASLDQISR